MDNEFNPDAWDEMVTAPYLHCANRFVVGNLYVICELNRHSELEPHQARGLIENSTVELTWTETR